MIIKLAAAVDIPTGYGTIRVPMNTYANMSIRKHSDGESKIYAFTVSQPQAILQHEETLPRGSFPTWL